MRYLFSVFTILLLTTLFGAGEPQGDGVRRITPAEAREAVANGRAIIVDVRGEESYKAGHIKGARWINLDEIASRSGELPKDKMIITYCA